MARKLRPLGMQHLDNLPCGCAGCVFWETAGRLEPRCGAACDLEMARAWVADVHEQWGECGRVAYEGDTILGFIKYAPARFLPQSRNFPSGPSSDDAVLLACMHISDDARQRGLGTLLLRAALRDLVVRNERSVEAFASTVRTGFAEQPVMGVEFLLRNGFNVLRPHPVYPLLRLDLRSLATWTENLESVLESLRIPARQPGRVPSPTVNMKGDARG